MVLLCLSYLNCFGPRAGAETSGQQSLKNLSLEELGRVEVTTVAKEPEQVWKTSAAIYVITQDDIERSGATSLPEVLRLAPGVEVARISGNKWSIGIRGFGSRLSRDVLVLIDGRTVYTTLLAGTYWEVQNVVLDDVERIEVIRGPGGTIWGPNAVNGVINIITKKAADTHGALVSAAGRSIDRGVVNARYGGGNGSSFDYRVYGLGFLRGPEHHADGNKYDSWRAVQGGFRMDWAKSNHDSFTFQGDLYDEGAGETVTATEYNPPSAEVVTGTARLSGGNILGRWRHAQGEGRDIELQAYYDRTNRHEPNFGDVRDTFDIDFLHRFRLPGRQQISWGLGTRISRGSNEQIVSGLTFDPAERTDQLYSLFLQDDIGLIEDRLSLALGTKLLKTNFSPVQPQPSVRLLWTPSGRQSLWAAYTHAIRTPSDAERDFFLSGYLGTAPGGLPFFARFNANKNFRAEQLNGYELGYRHLLAESFFFDASFFYNNYSGLFSEDVIGAPFVEDDPAPTHLLLPAQFGNGLRGTTKGVEIAPEWKPTSFWRVRSSYSYLQMNLEKSPGSLDIGSAPVVEGSSPKHEVTVLSGLDFLKRFSLDVTYLYVSALPALAIRGYSNVNVRVDWRASQHFKFSVVGRNLLQPYHYEYASDPGPNVGIKRTAYGQITWTH